MLKVDRWHSVNQQLHPFAEKDELYKNNPKNPWIFLLYFETKFSAYF